MKQDDMEKEKKKCSGTYLEDSHPDIYPESVKEESGYYVATKKKQGEYTIEDYRKLPEDERAELIDGTIYDMAATCRRQNTTRDLWLRTALWRVEVSLMVQSRIRFFSRRHSWGTTVSLRIPLF